MSPPEGLTATLPSRPVHPSSTAGPPLPFGTKPRSSVAMISAIVKQSCTSATWTSPGVTRAIAYASRAARTVAGKDVRAVVAQSVPGPAACPLPRTRPGGRGNALPRPPGERDAPRRAGALAVGGRDARESERAGEERGERALAREPLADEVADVERLDLPARDARVGERLAARGDGEFHEARALHPTERGGADANDRHLSHGRPPSPSTLPPSGLGRARRPGAGPGRPSPWGAEPPAGRAGPGPRQEPSDGVRV